MAKKNIPQCSIALPALRAKNGTEFSLVRIDVPVYKEIYDTHSESSNAFPVNGD